MSNIRPSLLALVVLCSSCAEETPPSDHELIDASEPRLGSVSQFFATENQVWVANDIGTVFYSANDGHTWTNYKTPLKEKPIKLHFTDKGQYGVLIGGAGTIHRTKNSGKTWKSNDIDLVVDYLRLNDEDESDFEIKVGQSTESLYLRVSCDVYSTKDGGQTWSKLTDKLRDSIDDSCIEHMYMNDNNELSHVAISVADVPNSLIKTNSDLTQFDIVCPSSGDPYYPKCAAKTVVPPAYIVLTQDTLAPDDIYNEHDDIQSEIFRIDPEKPLSVIEFEPTTDNLAYFSATENFVYSGKRTWAHFGKFLAYSDNMKNWVRVVNKPDYQLGSAYQLIPNAEVILHGNSRYVSSTSFNWGITYVNTRGEAIWNVLFDKQGNNIDLLKHSKNNNVLYGVTNHRLLKNEKNSNDWIVIDESNWEIIGFDIVEQRIVLVEQLDNLKRLKYSDNDGVTWVTSDAVESKYYITEFKCTSEQCLLATKNEIIRFLTDERMQVSIINTPIKYEGYGKNYGRDFIFSKDLNKIWFENGSALVESPANLESNDEWKVVIQEPIQFHTTMISPSDEHAFVFLTSGRKLIPVKFVNGNWQKLTAIKFPEINFDSYTHLDTIMCWLDDKRALFYTTDEYHRPLYALTNDSGNTWHRVSIHSKPSDCWRENDKLLLNSYKFGINH